MNWTVGRIALRTGVLHVDDLVEDHVLEALEAIGLFGERDISTFRSRLNAHFQGFPRCIR